MDVVVGFTHSARDHAVIERATEECRLRAAGLHVVCYAGGDGVNPQSVDAALKRVEQVRRAVDEVVDKVRADGVECTPHVVTEPGRHPADVLLEVADQVGADLVVVGIRQRTKVGKAFLGSNAQEVLLRAAAPVLAVKVD